MANSVSKHPAKRHRAGPAPVGGGQLATAAVQGVGLLVKAFQVLDLFTRERPSWTQVELQSATELSRSTLSRLVRFLHGRGYLAYASDTGRYALGIAAVDLGRRAVRASSLVELCGPTLAQIAEETGETVMLTSYDPRQGKVICMEQIPSVKEGLRVFERIGAAFPLYRGASSKAVLAFLSPSDVEAALAQMGHDAPDRDAVRLARELATIRVSGLATSLEETYPGVAGLAVPVFGDDGLPLGSIAVAAPILRMNLEARTRIGKMLTASGRKLCASLRRPP
ncbi:MAG: IclR family transcriptional regulator [Burkholderiaceae bacterium]